MELDEIIKEIESLPNGYISKKIIKGKTYFYLQYIVNGKLVSKYISANNIDFVTKQIKRRKELEKLKKEYTSTFINKKRILSKRELELTGGLYSGNTLVASFKNGIAIYINDQLAPKYIVRTKDLDSYLSSRCIDLSRPNARLLIKLLGIQNKNETFISLFSHGATITDNFWFKPSGSKLKYEDICFDNDLYSDLALMGKIPQFIPTGSLSPELTNIGSFEKAWKKINNEWWLYKTGNDDQIFSELFVYHFTKLLNIPTAVYEYVDGKIRSKNFADKYNFEPMYAFVGDNEDYNDIFNFLFSLSKDYAKSYLYLIWIDTIVYNVDRHNQNYGLLRDRSTGDYISLAPNFDNNLSLIAFNKTLDQDPKQDPFIALFKTFIMKNNNAKHLYQNIKNIYIDKNDIISIFKFIPIKKDEVKITNFIMERYEYLKTIC